MADNVPITPGSGRDIATDDVGSVHYQKIKVALGADGAVDTLLDSGQQLAANSVPVVLASDQPDIKVTLDGEQVTLSGTVQVQSNSANLATEATAAAIQAAVETIDNAISGSEMQVDLVAGGPIGATTDAEATGNGTVIAILKRLRTLIGDIYSIASNIYASMSALTMGDNAAYTAGMDRVFAVGGYLDDSSPSALTEGNIGTFRVTANRGLHVNLRDASGNELTPGGTQYTEDAAAGSSPTGVMGMAVRADDRYGDYTTNEGDAQALRVNYWGDLYVKDKDNLDILGQIWNSLGYTIGADTQTVGANTAAAATSLAVMDDWDESDRAKVNLIPGQAGVTAGAGPVAANTPRVTLASNDPGVAHLSNIQTATEQAAAYAGWIADALESNAADKMLVIPSGNVDHGDADVGNPVKIGHVVKNFDGTAPGAAVGENYRVNSIADTYGRQYVEITHPAHWTVSADYASAQTNTSIKAAPGAGLKLYVTDVIISNGATAGNITLLNGSGGSILLELYPGINGGLAMPFRTPIALSANTALCITSTTVTTHSVTICGYTAP